MFGSASVLAEKRASAAKSQTEIPSLSDPPSVPDPTAFRISRTISTRSVDRAVPLLAPTITSRSRPASGYLREVHKPAAFGQRPPSAVLLSKLPRTRT